MLCLSQNEDAEVIILEVDRGGEKKSKLLSIKRVCEARKIMRIILGYAACFFKNEM